MVNPLRSPVLNGENLFYCTLGDRPDQSTPTLPRVEIQIQRGINKYCRLCGVAVDRRSRVCRRCHIIVVGVNRYPLTCRPPLECKDCGSRVSYRSARGEGRCRPCYFENLREKREKARAAGAVGGKSSAFRTYAGAYHYTDAYGGSHYVDDDLGEGFNVGAAWGALKKCWRGLVIARNRTFDADVMELYARRIQHLEYLLGLEITDFSEFGVPPDDAEMRPD